MKNAQVVASWANGRKATNSRGSLTTDGVSLYSYRLKIGHRVSDGSAVVGDYTSGGGDYHSQTTSCHVGLARRWADTVMLPEVFGKLLKAER
jgi:hypothetical protein